MERYNYIKIPPFKRFALENFPFIEEDFDALTNWQLFCKIIKYLNNVIESQNNVSEAMVNLTDAFNELQKVLTDEFNDLHDYVYNYFANLDVQEEINIKLDEMAQDGTLETIVARYVVGLGVNVKSFGATGDGETDDTTIIQDAIDYCKANNIGTLYFPDGEYVISDKLNIDFSNFEIKGIGNSILKYTGEGTTGQFIRCVGTDTEHPLKNIKIHDLILDGTNQQYKGGKTMETPLLTSTQPMYRGIYGIYLSYVVNADIYNNKMIDIYGDGIVCSRCHTLKIKNNVLNDVSGGNPRSGGQVGYDNFGDGITCFSSFDCIIDSNTLINTRVYLASNNSSDIGTICGRSGIEYEYGLLRDESYTPDYTLFNDTDCSGLIMSNNYVYGYTKGCHLENQVPTSVISNTFIHNCIGILSSTHGYTNITNNHIDDDNCNVAIQSGYDTYSGGLAITSYTLERDISNFVVSNNIFKGKRKAIGIAKGNIIISNNTFFNDNSYAIYTIESIKNVKILGNTFYNNGIYSYNSTDFEINDNIFENSTRQILNSTTSNNFNIKNNKITNTLYFQGSNKNICFDNNEIVFVEGYEINRSSRFIDFYQIANLNLVNNYVNFKSGDDCRFLAITNTCSDINISNNSVDVASTRTTSVIAITSQLTRLIVRDNKIYGATELLQFIYHNWNLNFIEIENNYINTLAYIYQQTAGSTNGKSYQNNNKGIVKFNQSPNSALSKFVNNYFNNGERVYNFNGGATTKGWYCSSSGYYVTDTWTEGTAYALNKLIVSNGYVYKCSLAGTSTVAPEGTTLGTEETTADGLKWICCGTVAVLNEI